MNQNRKLYVVGIGPGEYEQMMMKAVRVLESDQLIVGYTVYVDLTRPHSLGRGMMATPMMKEMKRCRVALQKADRGWMVSMVCSGDSGVYGMAGLIPELVKKYPEVEMEIVPGVTVACGDVAVLRAPICHNSAVTSLNDLLTPMETIGWRLERTAQAGMVTCIYSPFSRKRADYPRRACDIALKYQRPETICGIVRNIGRNGESSRVIVLKELRGLQVDMFTTVYADNSFIRAERGKMITPRGYEHV